MPAKKIAVWFFKGGVGKTTTAVNIAAELARPDGPNQRVALLDFDGQCNVTSMLIPPPTYSSSDDEDEVQVAEYNGDANEPSVHYDVPKNVDPGTWISKYSDRLSPNAYTALAPFVGKIGRPTAPNMAVVPDFNGNLLVLPGSGKLFEHDGFLARASSDELASINMLGGFSELCRLLEERYDLDYIVVDLSPGAGALVRTVVMSCDYLLSPLMADFFSLSSARAMLTDVIPKWLQWQSKLIDNQVELRAGLDDGLASECLWFKSDPVKILPFLVCNYNIKGLAGAIKLRPMPPLNIIMADSQWIQALVSLLDEQEQRVPPQVRQLLVPNKGTDMEVRHVIPFIKDVGSICAYSQMINCPIPTMSMDNVLDADIYVGGGRIIESHQDQLAYAKIKYESLGKFLMWLPPNGVAHRAAAAASGNGGGGNDGMRANGGHANGGGNGNGRRASMSTASSYVTASSAWS